MGADKFASNYDVGLDLKLYHRRSWRNECAKPKRIPECEVIAKSDRKRLENVIADHYGRQLFEVPLLDLQEGVAYFKRLIVGDALLWAGNRTSAAARLGMSVSHFREVVSTPEPSYSAPMIPLSIALGTYKAMQHNFIAHFVRRALAQQQGDVLSAAESLGLPRSNLQRWMHLLAIRKDYYTPK